MKAQQQKQAAASLNYGAARAQRLPTVAAFGDYGALGRDLPSARATNTFGVSVRLPLFDGGRREAHRSDALSQLDQERIRTRDLERQIELEVRLAMESLYSAQSQVDTANEGLALANNELAQAKRRYEAGVANSLEATDAQTRLDRARDNSNT